MAFREKTTFVVGAGASAEFGLPIGTGLAAEIKKSAIYKPTTAASVASDGYLRQYIIAKYRDNPARGEAMKAANDIHEGIHTAVSIDAFIHRHRKTDLISKLGKVLIALEVLKAEGKSTMSATNWPAFNNNPNHTISQGDNKPKLVNPDYTWIGHFFRTMCDGIEDPNEVGRNITIICFNYDRCIEHYLTENIAAAYRIEPQQALSIVEQNIKIIHPYGYLGKLSVRPDHYDGATRLSYGYPLDGNFDLEEIADNIKTYTEQAHDRDQLADIHEAIRGCKNLVFLGFGFNNQNMNLLRVHRLLSDIPLPKKVFSTGFGLYRQIEGTLKRRIIRLFHDSDSASWKNSIHIEFGVGCEELFRIHDMNLAAFYDASIGFNDDGFFVDIS